jgi:hypothetical protein
MSSSDRVRNDSPLPAGTAPAAGEADPYASWLDRMQKARVRHAAITKNLYSWANYKSWTEKVKGSWEDGKEPKPKG